MLWMAFGILREAAQKKADLQLDGKMQRKRGGLNPFLAGITVSISNPYWSLWWATVGAGSLLLAGNRGLAGVASFYSGHILSDLVWYASVSTAVSKGRKLFTPLVYRIVMGICGLFLCWLAVYFVYSGFGALAKG